MLAALYREPQIGERGQRYFREDELRANRPVIVAGDPVDSRYPVGSSPLMVSTYRGR